LFSFRQGHYYSKGDVISKNNFKLKVLKKKMSQVEKNFQIFFQIRENENLKKILSIRSLGQDSFIRRNFLVKAFLNRIKVTISFKLKVFWRIIHGIKLKNLKKGEIVNQFNIYY